MKGSGRREPLPFTVDPLFYLSSFQTLEKSCCLTAAGLFQFHAEMRPQLNSPVKNGQ
jgi:hypothetical protein